MSVERIHVFGRHAKEPRGAESTNRRRARLHIDDRHLAEAICGAKHGDTRLTPAAALLQNLHFAIEHDVHFTRRLPFAEHDVTRVHAHRSKVRNQVIQHLIRERAKEANFSKLCRGNRQIGGGDFRHAVDVAPLVARVQ